MNDKNILAFIIPKNIEDLPLAVAPNLIGNFVVEEGGEAKRLPSDILNKILNTGISGDLDKVTAAEIPTTGYYKYDIFTAKTYTNVTPNITVSPEELKDNVVFGLVLNGVAYKALQVKPSQQAKQTFDPDNNIDPSTMNAAYKASDVLFDQAITQKAGFSDPVSFGFGVIGNDTNNFNVVRVNDIPITVNGKITKITQFSTSENTTNIKFIVFRPITSTLYKTIKVFTVSGFTPNAVSTVNITEDIEVKIGDRLGFFVDNKLFNLNTTTGNSLSLSAAAIEEGTENGINNYPGISWPYQFEVVAPKLTGDEAVSILENLNTNNLNSKTYYLEDYGAQVLDPFNPDAGIDCTNAYKNCLADIFNDPKVVNAKIALKGMYRLGGPLITQPNGDKAQITWPTIDFGPGMVIKNVQLVSEYQPVWEEQAIARMPVSYAGGGFYSSIYNQGTSTKNWVMSFGYGRDTSVFGEFNNINIFTDNITIIVRSHDENGQPVVNTMSGIDAGGNANFQFGRILVRTSVPAIDALMPSVNSIGLRLPKWNNHASLDGIYLRCNGFGTGLYATEHLELGKYIGLGNINGIHCEKFYPINIGQLILEMNKNPIVMGDGAYLNADIYQTERINDSSKWWYSTKDIIQESGTSSVTINRYVVHQEGGQKGVGSWDAGVRVKVINDEHSLSYNPLNMWQDLPTNPVNGLEGYHLGIRKIYLDGWKNALTGDPV
ncbi:hypothetical protein [Elizabethkingia anophelis]|uniref:hypothetical protein n=1 Tax=Elizabethkingia anophelis TaxID=1117645 RepID=UPI0038925F1A